MENNNQQIVTIADLDLIKQIIDLASSRGAFQGPELSQIGEVYNKLTAFLNLAAAQSQQIADAFAVNQIKAGLRENIEVLGVTGTLALSKILTTGSGTYTVAAAADVKAGVAFGASSGETGTYDPLAAAVFPAVADVWHDTGAYGPTGTDFEIQELKVELGQQVQAGQTMCLLSNHQMLSIEGRAFRDESACLERTVKERWPVEVDFSEENQERVYKVNKPNNIDDFHLPHGPERRSL
jgi:hypothetical protein